MKTLNALANQIDTTRMKTPSFRMVLTAVGDYAYRCPQDGVYVVRMFERLMHLEK